MPTNADYPDFLNNMIFTLSLSDTCIQVHQNVDELVRNELRAIHAQRKPAYVFNEIPHIAITVQDDL